MAGLLTYSCSGGLPARLSSSGEGNAETHIYGAYSSGTVQEFHLIPYSFAATTIATKTNTLQRYENNRPYKSSRKIFDAGNARRQPSCLLKKPFSFVQKNKVSEKQKNNSLKKFALFQF